jgi:hypothetical protein
MLRSVCAALIALAALVLPVQAATISTSDTFAGTLTTTFSSMSPNDVGTQTGSGTGDLLPLGSYTFTNSADVTVYGPSFTTFSITNGVFTDTFTHGTLFGTFTGSGTSGAVSATGTFDYVFTGGTGAYLGYTGTATQDATLTFATSAAAGTAVGSLTTTPLPSTWLMLLGGLVGLGVFIYRGPKKNAAAALAAA